MATIIQIRHFVLIYCRMGIFQIPVLQIRYFVLIYCRMGIFQIPVLQSNSFPGIQAPGPIYDFWSPAPDSWFLSPGSPAVFCCSELFSGLSDSGVWESIPVFFNSFTLNPIFLSF